MWVCKPTCFSPEKSKFYLRESKKIIALLWSLPLAYIFLLYAVYHYVEIVFPEGFDETSFYQQNQISFHCTLSIVPRVGLKTFYTLIATIPREWADRYRRGALIIIRTRKQSLYQRPVYVKQRLSTLHGPKQLIRFLVLTNSPVLLLPNQTHRLTIT